MIKLLNLLVETTQGLNYHLKHKLPLSENIYRYSSNAFLQLFTEARTLHRDGYLQLCEADRILLEETNIGEYGIYEGQQVPLDLPMMEIEILTEAELEEEKKQPALGKPKRGGSKKFYVYVKDPKTKRIKKVSFGMAGGGLRAKLNNSKARSAFSKRHNCPQKKDRTKASYWSCRLPRYAKLLGFKTTFSGYW